MSNEQWIEIAAYLAQGFAIIGFWELLHGFRPRQKSRK